jgi:tetratricopeptide (TPR) repeat protein
MTKAQAALTLGNWHYDLQQWPQAVQQYRVALSNGLDNPNVRTDYGNSLRFAGQPKQALEQYKIAQKQDPSHEQSLFNQGGLWAFSLKDEAKAIVAWRAYLKRFPNGQSAEAARQFIAQHQ